jgi:hypothetical protein
MLDAFAHDTREDLLVLAMFEMRPWEHGEHQLYQLQEKLNAYVSFILDGEMKESFPHLADKAVRIELRTAHEPSEHALGFLERARHQLSLQQISLEVVLIGEERSGCCGGGRERGGIEHCHHEGKHSPHDVDQENENDSSSERGSCCNSH